MSEPNFPSPREQKATKRPKTRTSFPQTLREAVTYFNDVGRARGFLARLRWPEGVTCPSCGSFDVSDMPTRSMFRCRLCRRQFSSKAGTIFEDSPIGLEKWWPAVWALSAEENGVSSHELARSVGVTQKTAWFMLQRLRLAMQAKGFHAPLIGRIGARETFMGSKLSTRRSRSTRAKTR